MSFTVNGIVWTPKTASEHAQTQLDVINAGRASRGESLLVASPNNAIWLELLAAGSLQQTYDEDLYQSSQSFNVSTCDDNQVLNMLPITGTTLIPATYSTVSISVTAAAGGAATIPAGTLAPFNGINFVVDTTTNVPAGTTVAMSATADTAGPYLATVGTINSFTTNITNVQTVTNLANSTQGQAVESVSSVRRRLVSGAGTINWDLDGTILAIRALQGIVFANVYFNSDTVNNLVLPGSVTIPPRHNRIIIQGTDVTGKLATTYMERQTAPTDGAYSQNWTSLSGQTIPVYYDIAANQPCYIRVYYDPSMPVSSGFDALIKQTIVNLGSTVTIGQGITSQFISEALNGFQYATITGVTLSSDNVTFGRECVINANAVAQFANANISVLSGP